MTRRTPNYQIPYPEGTDTPDVPRDMAAMATAVDGAIKSSEAVSPVFPQIMLSKKTATDAPQHGWRDLLFPDLHTPTSNTHPAFFGQKSGGVEIKKSGLYLSELQGKLDYGAGTDMQWKAVFNLHVKTAATVSAEVFAQQLAITPHNLGLVLANMSSVNWIQAGYIVGAGAYTYFGSAGFPKHAVHTWDYPSYLRVTYLGPVPTGLPDPTPPLTAHPGGPASAENP